MITSTSQVLVAALLLSLTAGNYKMYKHCLASGSINFIVIFLSILLLFRNLFGDTLNICLLIN